MLREVPVDYALDRRGVVEARKCCAPTSPTKQEAALEWLEGFLANGPRDRNDALREGKLSGHTEITLRRVATTIGDREARRRSWDSFTLGAPKGSPRETLLVGRRARYPIPDTVGPIIGWRAWHVERLRTSSACGGLCSTGPCGRRAATSWRRITTRAPNQGPDQRPALTRTRDSSWHAS